MSYEDLEYFQGRNEAKKAFDDLLQGNQHWLLFFAGFSGIGKSTLLEWLRVHRCEPDDILCAYVNFKNPSIDFKSTNDYNKLLNILHRKLEPFIPYDVNASYLETCHQIADDLEKQKLQIRIEASQTGGSENRMSVQLGLGEKLQEDTRRANDRQKTAFIECLKHLQREKWILFWDTFEIIPEEDRKWIWSFLEEAHSVYAGLRVVIATQHLTGGEQNITQ